MTNTDDEGGTVTGTQALVMVGEAADTAAGQKAVQLELATKAIHAKEMIAKESSLVLLPDGASDAASLVAQAMSIIRRTSGSGSGSSGASAPRAAQPASSVMPQRSKTPGPWGT